MAIARLATPPLCAPAVFAQTSQSSTVGQTAKNASIHGVVINDITNQPVSRVLVQASGQAALTSHDGKFTFSDLSGSVTTVKATKPGFYESLDPNQSAINSAQIGSPDEIQIRLYPEALITGTLTATSGDPLAQVNVQALRHVEEDGVHWVMGGQTYTNADGQFRLPLPGGDYALVTQFSQSRSGAGQAILPTVFPAAGASSGSRDAVSTIRLPSGTEQHLDLHPAVHDSHIVNISVDSSGGVSPARNIPQIQAHLANGLAFSPPSHGTEKPGEVVVNLPTGTYLLSATAGNRDDASSYGETKVTVADEDVSGVVIHMQQATELTVEASVDSSATPTISNLSGSSLDRQLGIFFEKTDSGVNLGSGKVSPASHRGTALSFSLLPGTYRLRATTFNPWYIESASAGGTDLLTNDLVVDGSSSLPLRIIANNDTATVKGTVKASGIAASAFVYFIADAPSVSPVVDARTGPDGSFSRALLRPGSYRVVASENRALFNLAEPAVLARFASYMKTLTVGTGETESIDLVAVPVSEWKQ